MGTIVNSKINVSMKNSCADSWKHHRHLESPTVD